jgi:hypothetical protein
VADWYVYQHDGDPLGPWSTAAIADAILAGKLAPDVWVAAPGGPRWLRALDVPVIGRLVEGIPTKPTRRDSGLRLMPAAYRTDAGRPAFGSTMMMVTDDEVQLTDSELSALSADRIASSNAPIKTAPLTARTSPEQTAKMAAWMQEVGSDALVTNDPPTEPALPPFSTEPFSPRIEARVEVEAVESVEAPSTDRRRRRKNG